MGQRVTLRTFSLLEQSVKSTDDGATGARCTGRAILLGISECDGEFAPTGGPGHVQIEWKTARTTRTAQDQSSNTDRLVIDVLRLLDPECAP